MGRYLYGIIFFLLASFSSKGQVHLDGSIHEVYPAELSLKKPPKYEEHNPCEVIFVNMTNIPIQLTWLKPNGSFEKLFYLAEKDTVKFPFKTNHHIVVSYLGFNAVSVFIPGFDRNVCKVHDKQFRKPKKMRNRKFKFKSDELKQEKFKYKPETPAYKKGTGPTVFIDQFHANPSLSYELKGIERTLKYDGYQVQSFNNDFSSESLKDVKYLILPQPLTPTVNGWMIDSSEAYTHDEYVSLFEWVENGGQLIVLSDYTPLGNRLETLYTWLNIDYFNGLVQETGSPSPVEYTQAEKSLVRHPYLDGRNNYEAIESIFTFGGAAFRNNSGKSLLEIQDNQNCELIEFTISSALPTDATGLCQGGFFKIGEGQVLVISNLAMFQTWVHKETGNKIGMNNEMAYQNAQYLLNLIHALQGFISF
jgi:hypothetical protein